MRKNASLLAVVVLAGLVPVLGACTPIVAPPAATVISAPPPASADVPEYVIELTDDSQVISPTLPAGTLRIVAKNTGKDWHAVIFRRLNEGVTPEQFAAAFAESPFRSLALTTQLGGPDVAPGTSTAGYYRFEPGAHALVDNATAPPRFVPFTVAASTATAAQPPGATVAVEMKDDEFVMPAAIQTGPQWWQWTNAGQSINMMGIVKLAPDKTVDDIRAWYETEEGPEPYEWVAFWNLMSPGATSWGELDLPVGAYWVLGFQTELTPEGMAPPALGVTKELTVTE